MIEQGQFTVHASFLAQPDKYDEMKAISRQSFDLTRDTPGLVHLLCLEPTKAEEPFVIVSIWRAKADFQAFLQTPRMREFHSNQAIQTMFETAMAEATANFCTVMGEWHTAN